jgi:hypothetical protein
MTTHAQEVLDRALRLEKWSRDEVERFLLLEKLGRVDVLKDADGNTVALKNSLFCQELQQSVSELLPQMRQVSKWQLSADDRDKLAYLMRFFEEVLSKMG